MQMQKKPNLTAAAAEMRRRAEARLRGRYEKPGRARPDADTERLIHELEVHQIELEMQNEELEKARREVESGLEKYSELYNFAPVGYLSLDHEGMIREANLTAAGLLGTERSRLLQQRLGFFIAPADRPTFTAFVTRVFQGKAREFCEVTLLKEGEPAVAVRIGGEVAASGQECRVVLEDVTQQKRAEAVLRQSEKEALAASRSEVQSGRDKLWKLAANAFSVLGETRMTEDGIEQHLFGDSPEAKMGLAPGSVPKDVYKFMGMIHPDDVRSLRHKVEQSVATGQPLRTVCRVSDGSAGWRWLQTNAICIEERDGKHVHWLWDTRDITELKEREEELRKSLEELRQLKAQLQSENLFLREEVDRRVAYADIIGHSAPLTRVLEQVELVAATSSTVLVSGETGTGKELIARAIHNHGDRKQRLFIAVNCAALPAALVESELFGHEKGAFTGAMARRVGRFEQADGGTLFLDEVGELPLETQAKMLRVLQSGEFERVGGARLLKTNVRVIAASNGDLEQAVRDGRFRSDLYHRLSVFPIHLPPLRERREDIPLLAAYLATRKARQLGRNLDRISDLILDRLTAYDWPGNVRELENVLERAIILSPGASLRLEAIQLGAAATAKSRERHARVAASADPGEMGTMAACERAHIRRVCQATAWKIKGPDGAAIKLGLKPGTLYSRMKKLGIQRPTAP